MRQQESKCGDVATRRKPKQQHACQELRSFGHSRLEKVHGLLKLTSLTRIPILPPKSQRVKILEEIPSLGHCVSSNDDSTSNLLPQPMYSVHRHIHFTLIPTHTTTASTSTLGVAHILYSDRTTSNGWSYSRRGTRGPFPCRGFKEYWRWRASDKAGHQRTGDLGLEGQSIW